MLGEHDRRFEFPQQRDEFRHGKTVVAHLDHMAQRAALELARQQLEKFAEIGIVELLGRRELPQHRAEAVAKLQHAGIIKPFHGIAGLRQHPPVGGEARPLQRKHKTVRHFARPFAKALRLLRAVIGAVDLDRGQLRRGIFQFLRLRQLLRIKHPAPRREGPAADRRYRCWRHSGRRFSGAWSRHELMVQRDNGAVGSSLIKPFVIGQFASCAANKIASAASRRQRPLIRAKKRAPENRSL